MIAVAIALIVAGILLGIFIPPYGFVVAGVALVLLVVWLVGAGRRAHDPGAEPR